MSEGWLHFAECVIAIDNDDAHDKDDDDDGKITIKIQTNEAHSKKEYQIFKVSKHPFFKISDFSVQSKNKLINGSSW